MKSERRIVRLLQFRRRLLKDAELRLHAAAEIERAAEERARRAEHTATTASSGCAAVTIEELARHHAWCEHLHDEARLLRAEAHRLARETAARRDDVVAARTHVRQVEPLEAAAAARHGRAEGRAARRSTDERAARRSGA